MGAEADEWIDTEFTYDSLDRLTTEYVNLNGFSKTESYEYLTDGTDTTGLVSKHTVDGVEYSYTYDSVGNITAVRKNGNLKYRYSYDKLGQLTEAIIYSDTYSTDYLCDVYEYSYDKSGNITFVGHQYGESVSYSEGFNYTYSNSAWGDLLTSYNGTAITYDAIGNPLKWRNATAIEWQGRNLTLFSNSNGEIYNYAYNADGIRTQKNIFNANGDFTGSTDYIYDGTKLIAENRSGTWLYYFYDANGAVTGMYYNNVLYYFRKNLQGDVTGIYNANGTLVVEYEYTPYGAIFSTTGSMATTIGAINPFRYRGYYYDTETELYYLITRYYDPEVGRFLNADVYTSTGKGFVGNNMFAYCLNNPVNMIDIDGRDPIPQWATRIINGEGTEEDYEKALSVNADAWVGYARISVDRAIEIAKSRAIQKAKSRFGSPKQFSLHDSDRFEDKTSWRDTIISVEMSGPSLNPQELSMGIGTISVDVTTGGWEGKYGSLMIFNFGHAEVGFECKNGEVNVGAMASCWSPDASVNFLGVTINIGAEVCAVGCGAYFGVSRFKLSLAALFGLTIEFEW